MAMEIAEGVFTVAKVIYERVQLVKANQAQCKRLAERIQVVEAAIIKLDQIPASKDFAKGLQMLKGCLDAVLHFINQFTTQSKWYQKALYAGKNEGRFNELNQQLEDCLPLLNLGMMTHQLIKREEDVADQKADAKALLVGQAQILSLNKEMMQELQAFKGAAAERDQILIKQLASLKLQLEYAQRPAEAKSVIATHDHIAYCELLFDEFLSTGSTSQIYKGKWQGQPVAIKLFTPEMSGPTSAEFVREVKIMSRLKHPNIVQFYGAALEGDSACIVMELSAQNLPTHLTKCVLNPSQQKQIALDIARGLQYLHGKEMIHRDLRSTHILLSDSGQAKITDFGLTKTQALSIQSLRSTGSKITPAIAWCAPEVLSGEEVITAAADIYSFGTILWELFTSKQPFEGLSTEEVTKKILAGKREQLPKNLPKGLGEIIERCWLTAPSKRPKLDEMIHWLEHYDPVQSCYQHAKQMEEAKEYKQAKKYYQLAADAGLVNALTSLGMFALKGQDGRGADKIKAYQLFLAAAQKGHNRAMRNLAVMLDKGDGIPANQRQALAWYEKAGDETSLSRAKRLREKLAVVAESLLQSSSNPSMKLG